MRERCRNPKNIAYHNYGGRGIGYCDEWERFEPFSEWAMANGYEEGLQLDRIDNDGDYAPDNCRWVTPSQNCRNQRKSVWITAHGETIPLEEAAEKYGVNKYTLAWRVRHGWDHEKAIVPA
jgi:hypothetical protein